MSRSLATAANILYNQPVLDQLASFDCNPIEIMAQFALGGGDMVGADVKSDLQFAAAKELAQYLFPKKRSLDVQKDVKHTVSFEVVSFKDIEPNKAIELAEEVEFRHKAKRLVNADPAYEIEGLVTSTYDTSKLAQADNLLVSATTHALTAGEETPWVNPMEYGTDDED